jgi:Zn-dependent protease with chaperone function
MFGNIAYLIIALLIYSTYPVSDETSLSPSESLFFFAVAALVFAGLVRHQYRRLAAQLPDLGVRSLSVLSETVQARLSVMAIGVFALDIYGLGLPSILGRMPLLKTLPTLQALIFLAIFMGYLTLVWSMSHDLSRMMDSQEESKKAYILSNIQITAPVLLPWLLLSGVSDFLRALPFDPLRRFLSSATGEISYFVFFLLVVAVFGPVMIQRFWQCRPLPQGPDRIRIEALCRRARVRYADILGWPLFGGRMVTAGVMGLVGRFRYILVTPALLQLLTPPEIDAVIAHEIGHVRRRHLLYYMIFFAGYMLLSLSIIELIPYVIIYFQPLYRWVSQSGISSSTVISTAFSISVIIIFLFYFRVVFGYFMRNFERQADAYVYTLFDSAAPMITTFQKIAITSGMPPDKPNWHHFSIAERIAFLKGCESDPSLIQRHDRKVRKSLGIYLAALAAVGGFAYAMNFGETGRQMGNRAFERIVLREIEKQPANTDLFTTLGDLYFTRKHYEKTDAAYRHAIRLDPDNATAMNNLAWLLATCEDPAFRDPEKALALALGSVKRNPAPHALDTLAEAYFINGNVRAAVATEKLALSRAKTNQEIYRDQLEKFQTALDKGG